MPATPAYEFAVPVGIAASFVNDEKAISPVTPLNTAAARTTYHLSKWFSFLGGVYTLKCACEDAAVWYSSVEYLNGRLLCAVKPGDGVVELEVFITEGRRRLDVILSNLSTVGTDPCYIVFSLWLEGRLVYASSAAGWVANSEISADEDVPAESDYRLALPVLSVLPDWQSGVAERLDWMTEILPSETDTEQRRSLRRFPRRSIEASFARWDEQRQLLDSFFTGIGTSECLVPLWFEQYVITATLGSSVAFPEGSLAMREFHLNDLVIVMGKSPFAYEVLVISAYDEETDTIEFADAPEGTWAAGSRIIPLRRCRLIDTPQLTNLTDSVATVQVRAEFCEQEYWPAPAWLAVEDALFDFRVNWSTPVTVEYDRTIFVIDSEVGPMDVTDLGHRARLTTRAAITIRGRQQAFALRQFLSMVRGKAVRFWMPSLMNDLSPIGNISGTYFDVKKNGFAQYVRRYQGAKSMVCILLNNGSPPVYREVTEIAQIGEVERVLVGETISSIPLSSIRRVMFVAPCRFDQDGFELKHEVDDSALIRLSVIVRTNDVADMPALGA